RRHGELRETVRAADILGRFEERGRVEILHLAGDMADMPGEVKGGDPVDPAAPCGNGFPEGGQVVSNRSDNPDSGNDDSTFDRHKVRYPSHAHGGMQIEKHVEKHDNTHTSVPACE